MQTNEEESIIQSACGDFSIKKYYVGPKGGVCHNKDTDIGVIIPPGAIHNEKQLIYFGKKEHYNDDGVITELIFGPHGIEFSKPVQVFYKESHCNTSGGLRYQWLWEKQKRMNRLYDPHR